MNSKHLPNFDVLEINGVALSKEDFSDDVIQFARMADNENEFKVGINGGVQKMRNTDNRGLLSFGVWEGSDAHKLLLTWKVADIELLCSYRKGGVGLPPRIGHSGGFQKLEPSDSADGKVMVEIVTSTILGA